MDGAKINLISYDGVSFSYDGTKAIIQDIDFTIKSGEKLAIIGKSGSGKTTLVNLLLKFYKPNQGKIWINDRDISSINPRSLRRKFGVVQQIPSIFSGTIRDNIRVGELNASDEEIARAVEIAQLNFFATLPKGLSTYKNFKEQIIIVITHRLYNIIKADKILVLDDGRIVGQGRHEDLYKSCPIYKMLYDEQFLKNINRMEVGETEAIRKG